MDEHPLWHRLLNFLLPIHSSELLKNVYNACVCTRGFPFTSSHRIHQTYEALEMVLLYCEKKTTTTRS